MTYLSIGLTVLAIFQLLALTDFASRLKKNEERIEIMRAALDRHLTDGSDYRSLDKIKKQQAMLETNLRWLNSKKTSNDNGGDA